MIRKELIARGYKQGTITLKTDPNMESGTVAAIGDYWFYFGGLTAEEMSPEEYRKNIPEDDIIREIWDVLNDFRTENPDEYAYYENFLMESVSRWQEIRCDYMDEDDRFWTVDAWETADDNEEGTVIAYIDDITGRVIYIDPLARVDKYAQEVISERLSQLECPLRIEKKPGRIVITRPEKDPYKVEVDMPSRHGTLVASLEPNEYEGTGYNGVFVGLVPCDDPYVYLDLTAVCSNYDEDSVDIRTWTNIWDENYDAKYPISGSDLQALVKSCYEPEYDWEYYPGLWLNGNYDMSNIVDSMEIDSDELIASLSSGKLNAEIRVCGEVKVYWSESETDVNEDGELYRHPSEFPANLKALIRNEPVTWQHDPRVYAERTNWFELFVRDAETVVYDEVVEAAKESPEGLYKLLSSAIDETNAEKEA